MKQYVNDQVHQDLVALLKSLPEEEFERVKKDYFPNGISSSFDKDLKEFEELNEEI